MFHTKNHAWFPNLYYTRKCVMFEPMLHTKIVYLLSELMLHRKCVMFEHMLHTNLRCFLSEFMLQTKTLYVRTYVTHKNIMPGFRTIITYENV